MHPLLNTAIKAARRAGSIITRASEDISSLTITSKNMNDFVSEVDLASEKEIIRVLSQAYPDHGFIAEESGLSEKKENMWIIDPLDGTTNFLHNIPQYCVSIALKQKEEITHAVVYDPNRNHLFTASKGQGAYLNDRRIRVSKTPKLQDSIIGTGIPFRDFTYLPQYLVILEELVRKTAGIRRPGSAALDLAYVAAGWFDGFWEIDLSTWDVAAEEATEPGAPSWMPDRYNWLQYRATLYKIANGLSANDPICIELAIEYIELNYFGSYSGYIRERLARLLKNANLEYKQAVRIKRHIQALRDNREFSYEFRAYLKLEKRIMKSGRSAPSMTANPLKPRSKTAPPDRLIF